MEAGLAEANLEVPPVPASFRRPSRAATIPCFSTSSDDVWNGIPWPVWRPTLPSDTAGFEGGCRVRHPRGRSQPAWPTARRERWPQCEAPPTVAPREPPIPTTPKWIPLLLFILEVREVKSRLWPQREASMISRHLCILGTTPQHRQSCHKFQIPFPKAHGP